MGGLGSRGGNVSPLPTVKYHYSHRFFTYSVKRSACPFARKGGTVSRQFSNQACAGASDSVVRRCVPRRASPSRGASSERVDSAAVERAPINPRRDPIRGHCQAGSLTGAVHLSKNNAGVLRPAQRGQKPRVEQKGKSWLDLDVQYA